MSVSSLSASYIDTNSIRVSWSGGTAPYRVYADGSLMATTSATSVVIRIDGNELIDVRDATESDPTARPARARIYWRGVSGASSYRVYEYVSGSWILRATYTDDGRGHWNWTSRRLEDGATHQFRVTSLDAAGNESSGDDISLVMVRTPDAPDPTFSTAPGAGKTVLTISE
jgi:hypothetical protein